MNDLSNYHSQADEIERLKKIIASYEGASKAKVKEANKRIANANWNVNHWKKKHGELKCEVAFLNNQLENAVKKIERLSK